MIIFWTFAVVSALNVGITNDSPLMQCNETSYSGLIPDLVIMILQSFNYNSDLLSFICTTQSSIEEQLLDGSLDISVLTIAANNYDTLSFSTAILNNGLTLIGKSHTKSSYWLVFDPFHFSLWLTLIILPILIGHLFWVFERSESGPIELEYAQGVFTSIWHTYLAFFFLGKEATKKMPTRIIMCTYWFLLLILTASYIGSLALTISMPSKYLDMKSYKDVNDKIIGTFTENASVLGKFGMSIKQYDSGLENALEMVNDIDSKVIDAAVLPYSMALYVTSMNCGFEIIGTVFVDQYLAFAFSPLIKKLAKNNFMYRFQGISENLELKALINQKLLLDVNGECNHFLTTPLTLDLAIGPLMVFAGGILMALPLFLMFRKKFTGVKITESEVVTHLTTIGNEKKNADFMNLIIKFDCVLGSSKNNFAEKMEELKNEIERNSEIQLKYQRLLKQLSFRIENL